jgi:predicted transcriptional regulator
VIILDNINTNDCFILNNIVYKEKNLGYTKVRGITVEEVIARTNLSSTKVRGTLKKLLASGYIDYGIKRIKSNTFHITKKGLDLLDEIQVNYLLEESGE